MPGRSVGSLLLLTDSGAFARYSAQALRLRICGYSPSTQVIVERLTNQLGVRTTEFMPQPLKCLDLAFRQEQADSLHDAKPNATDVCLSSILPRQRVRGPAPGLGSHSGDANL